MVLVSITADNFRIPMAVELIQTWEWRGIGNCVFFFKFCLGGQKCHVYSSLKIRPTEYTLPTAILSLPSRPYS